MWVGNIRWGSVSVRKVDQKTSVSAVGTFIDRSMTVLAGLLPPGVSKLETLVSSAA